ncbi:hypothetical protein [Neobacillus sp. 114]|uniref:hypothetical protein n=1 Tax=Neobacillus sp. 114 TaxID=3048535 RepID=UPI0024C3B732|nr:hypothetical protein [Neobacillus sp. 114]
MGKKKVNTPAKLIIFCILFGIIVIFNSVLVIGSPYVFIKVLNLIVVIILSSIVGAFIREIFILNKKKKSHTT